MDRSGELDTSADEWGLVTAARHVGSIAWFDGRCSEVLSSWAASSDDARLAVTLGEQARHRAWHAELWFARLPELRELPAASSVAPSGPGVVEFCETLDGLRGDDVRLAVLAGVVQPHQVSVTRRLRARCGPAADRALARTVELVHRDQLEHWEQLAGLLDARCLAWGPDERAERLAALVDGRSGPEGLLLAAGGITGSG